MNAQPEHKTSSDLMARGNSLGKKYLHKPADTKNSKNTKLKQSNFYGSKMFLPDRLPAFIRQTPGKLL